MALPKAELHVHVEGTFEPELIFAIAQRNRVPLDYPDVAALEAAYRFTDLESFLRLYYRSMAVLRTELDFYELTMAYLQRAWAQGVRHAEIFFDPQAHVMRGIAFERVVDGIWSALQDGHAALGITAHLIACFLRDHPVESAAQTLDAVLRYQDRIVAVGLDSAEAGNPPARFLAIFDRARANGLLTVCHAGEEGPAAYVWQALDLLKVSRIDHGVRSMDDPELVERLRRQRIPLTVCPLSNLRLCVVPSLQAHPLKRMLEAGLMVTCNSDDPAYFGGYAGENFVAVRDALALQDADLIALARNSFEASFISDVAKKTYLEELDRTTAPVG
ncbi:MAG: adenosine deaminase [Candidatus Eremiobacteraeota bacterium]|nr:adenosine deaminase [Candidatus Eremiobacteraeota bacterium]